MRLTATGTLIGVGAAWAGARLLADLLYGVGPTDPTVFVCAAAVLALTALFACVVPTLRALRVDPIASIRSQ